jgi:hypothetical protein
MKRSIYLGYQSSKLPHFSLEMDVEKLVSYVLTGENVKWCSHYVKQYDVSPKKLKTDL